MGVKQHQVIVKMVRRDSSITSAGHLEGGASWKSSWRLQGVED